MTDCPKPASPPVIALMSDFGLTDAYAGTLKGVIHRIAPLATLIDLTHQIPPHSILIGAACLSQAAPYFPKATVFLAVVDPGVGTDRRALGAESGGMYYVAPDNGLLSFVLDAEARIHALENRAYWLEKISATFHGRDIFAPAAAHLARGVPLEAFGPPIYDPVRIPWPQPEPVVRGVWRLPIIAADHFGNLITCLRPEDLPRLGLSDISIRIGQTRIGAVSPTFGALGAGQWLAYWGSGGLLEIGINSGNASAVSGLGAGDTVRLEDPAVVNDAAGTGGPGS